MKEFKLPDEVIEVKEKNPTDLIVIANPKTGKTVVRKGKMSSARFGDQEVVPGPGYEAASLALNNFVKSKGKTVGDSGLNIGAAIELLKTLKPADANTLMGLIRTNVKIVFGKQFENPRPDYKTKLIKNINGIVSSIEKGDLNSAMQFWSRASFNYYMAAKHDDGVLFINIPAKTCVYYNSAEDLQGKGLRLDADTTYLSGGDPKRTVYPQIKVVPRDYGTSVITPELEKVSKQGKEVKTPAAAAKQVAKQKENFMNWATKFANLRNVTDQRIIPKMADAAYEMRKAGVPIDAVISELETQFPQLIKNVVRARQVPSANRLYTPYVPPETSDEETV